MWVNYCVIISRCKKALASCSWMHYGPVKGCKPSFSVFLNVHIVHLTHMSPRTVVYWHHHHHHHHVHEGLGVFPVPWSSKWNWSLHLFLGRPTFLRLFGLYCNACFIFRYDTLKLSLLPLCITASNYVSKQQMMAVELIRESKLQCPKSVFILAGWRPSVANRKF